MTHPPVPGRVSVVVPARNCAAHLRACLTSLRLTDYPDYEVVVVDDASTDDTPAVAEELGARCLRLERQGGPAAARNRGGEAAAGEYLLFLDADVCAHPDTVRKAAEAFTRDAGVDAAFGSYDLHPREPNLLSRYKNLIHRFVHQQSSERAWTFWTGCGAIRRSVFLEAGGFDEAYTRPCVEDIELGMRLSHEGRRIVLKKDVEATHLKRWTLWGIVKSDVWDRAVPWTRLLLKARSLPDDLNLGRSQRVCTVLAYLLLGALLVGAWFQPAVLLLPVGVLLGLHLVDVWSSRPRLFPWLAGAAVAAGLGVAAAVGYTFGVWALIPLGLLAGIVLLNRRLYAFFARERGWLFAALVLPMQVLYYLYSGVGLGLGIAGHVWDAIRGRPKSNAARLGGVSR